MAKFAYTGRSASGEMTQGALEASDENTAAKMLSARSIIPISIVVASTADASSGEGVNIFTPKVTLEDLVIFSRQMHALSRSGIPILQAVSGLSDSTSSLRLKLALKEVLSALERGRSLSSALNLHPTIFDQLFVSIVHVGENTGQIDSAFLQLSEYLEREQETRRQIKAATRYPVFVLIAIAMALVIMNIFVIPKFADMFSKFNAELPGMTQFLINMSDFFVNQWYLLLGIVFVITFSTRKYLQTDKGSMAWDKFKLRAPIIGSVIRRSLLGRFARSFSMMVRSGIALTTALNLVADAVNNRFMHQRIQTMRQSIEKGESLSRVAISSELFTPLVLQMIHVGEETGRVDELMSDVAEFYEREVDYDLKSLTAKIEPILIGVVAVMVLVLALGIFTPMWDMMSAIKGR